jgi:hypothetical protein
MIEAGNEFGPGTAYGMFKWSMHIIRSLEIWSESLQIIVSVYYKNGY